MTNQSEKPKPKKECAVCGAIFEVSGTQKYCRSKCRDKARKKQLKESYERYSKLHGK
jgi:predicted nucleic acid-binding Zn ribbon protein